MAKRCFVIQGFGKKHDYEQGKLFDLDASYQVIKEAIEEAGITCHRADELRRSGMTDEIMYDELLSAELVVADLTTLNFQVAYQLGVRLALRPRATLVVGERGMNFPFDINHMYIHTYNHLGEDVGNRDARRFKADLRDLARKVLKEPQNDSPVYLHLRELPVNGFINVSSSKRTPKKNITDGSSIREIKDKAKTAMHEGRFSEAIELWRIANDTEKNDDLIIQQLALATYKSRQHDPEEALKKAKKILEQLTPRTSLDPDTVGLWAAVHKRLFELTRDLDALDEALFALERGFFIKGDYYNGINLAFLLDTKAVTSNSQQKTELRGVAKYVRRKVKDICKQALETDLTEDAKYWVLATLYEACVGLEDEEEASYWEKESKKVAKADWMNESTKTQIEQLRALIED